MYTVSVTESGRHAAEGNDLFGPEFIIFGLIIYFTSIIDQRMVSRLFTRSNNCTIMDTI